MPTDKPTSYFGPLLNQRLIELDADQKEDKYRAGCDTDSVFWISAEELEEAIQAKVAEQNILAPARGEEFYFSPNFGTARWDRLLPLPLAHGVPDAERVYLTQAEQVLAHDLHERLLGGLPDSEYLRRHPEMLEAYIDVIAPDGTLEIWPEERSDARPPRELETWKGIDSWEAK